MKGIINLKPMGLLQSLLIFSSAAVLMYMMTHFLIPFLSVTTGIEIIFFWFLVGGLGIFLPLIVAAYFILKSEGSKLSKELWIERLRFKKIGKRDVKFVSIGIVLTLVLTFAIMTAIESIFGKFDTSPSFMKFEPLSSGRYWLLAVWFPYWILNIMGEEILWRGVMLPRQELSFGKYTWLLHGTGWLLFHIPFGLNLLVTLLPLLFIQSYVVQATKNSWNGVLMHGIINGPSFIAIAFGAI